MTKVVYSSYGYGYQVVISHGGGVETLYGHNSKIYVKPGTGWSRATDCRNRAYRAGNRQSLPL